MIKISTQSAGPGTEPSAGLLAKYDNDAFEFVKSYVQITAGLFFLGMMYKLP